MQLSHLRMFLRKSIFLTEGLMLRLRMLNPTAMTLFQKEHPVFKSKLQMLRTSNLQTAAMRSLIQMVKV
ncbi:hypothetical protein SG26_19600 (plasmid) [Haloarcula sp. CBA1115]|nr:hypothetical protein SG26_19600 [Haloarcula sp. CBA1115]